MSPAICYGNSLPAEIFLLWCKVKSKEWYGYGQDLHEQCRIGNIISWNTLSICNGWTPWMGRQCAAMGLYHFIVLILNTEMPLHTSSVMFATATLPIFPSNKYFLGLMKKYFLGNIKVVLLLLNESLFRCCRTCFWHEIHNKSLINSIWSIKLDKMFIASDKILS